jgi:hypothetical protein
MATKEIYLTGKIKWAKGLKDMDEKFKSYSAAFYPTDKSMNEYKQLGLKTKFKMDDEGESFSIRRPHSKVFKEELKVFGPPEVFVEKDGEQTAVDPYTVGNGSDVTVKLSVYDTGYGKGSRLEAVRVDNLIEFIPNSQGEGAKKAFAPPFDN